jgi:hypothetical protein
MLLVSNPMALPNEKRMIPLIDCRGPSASNNRFHPDHTFEGEEDEKGKIVRLLGRRVYLTEETKVVVVLCPKSASGPRRVKRDDLLKV